MSKIKGAIVVDTERCKGCALCVEACPHDVIALAQKKVNVLLRRQQGQRFHFYNGQTSRLPGQDRADGTVTVLQGLGPEGIALACGLLQNDLAVSSGLGLRLCQQ